LEFVLKMDSEMDSEGTNNCGTAERPMDLDAQGRVLRLEFVGSPPELLSLSFRYSSSSEQAVLRRGKPGLQWGHVAKAFSSCILNYLISDSKEDEGTTQKGTKMRVHVFSGGENSYAASLGNAINDNDGWLARTLVRKKGAIRPSVIHSIFVRGANKSGKNKNLPRQIAIDTAFLPRASIQVTWQETPQDYAQHVAQADLTSLLSAIPEKDQQPTNHGSKRAFGEPRSQQIVSVSHFRMHEGALFGRDEWLKTLDKAWEDPQVKVFTLWAWGGTGKSAIVGEWLKQVKSRNYLDADVLAWSLDTHDSANADAFLDFALRLFNDPAPSSGERWEKGIRLARLMQRRKTLLVLDGLEKLQQPPSPTAGKLADPAMVGLLGELAAHTRPSLCVLTTRYPVTDLEPFRNSATPRAELTPLSAEAGRHLLRAYSVKGNDNELEQVSEFFKGHALTLTLLGSYLDAAWSGNIHKWQTVKLLRVDDEREGHAKSMMAAYESWFKGKPELLILRLIGLFDRPPDIEDLNAIRFDAQIPGLTDTLRNLSVAQWAASVRSLQDKRLLVQNQSSKGTALEAHPLIREYFEETLRQSSPDIWQKGNEFLYDHYSRRAPRLPQNIEAMEYLFCAMTHGCKASKHQTALDSIYIPRIMRGEQRYAAEKLGALGGLLVVLSRFFEGNNWFRPVETLNRRSQLFVLKEAARALTAVNGYAAPEVEQCYLKGLQLCEPRDKGSRLELLLGLGRVFRLRGQLKKSGDIANQLIFMTKRHKLRFAAERAVATNYYYTGHFHKSLHHATMGIVKHSNRRESLSMAKLDVNEPSLSCLGYCGLCRWFIGKPDQSVKDVDLAVKKAKLLGHYHTITVILLMKAMVHQFRLERSETQKAAVELTGFCADRGFFLWRISGEILCKWANITPDIVPCHKQIEALIEEWKGNHAELFLPYWYGLLADGALTVNDFDCCANALADGLYYSRKNSEHWWDCELIRLSGMLMVAKGQQEEGVMKLRNAIDCAQTQRSLSLELRARLSLAQCVRGSDLAGGLKASLIGCFNKFTEGFTMPEMLEAAGFATSRNSHE
jgi:hypothetical protein